MNIEESIEILKNSKKLYLKEKIDSDILEEAIKEAVNLIEKQSKEIEEYKKQLDLDYVDKHFVPIERYNQLEKEIEELKESKEEMGKVLDEWINGERTSIFHIHKAKRKSKIEELEKEQEDNRKNLYNAVNNLCFKEIDKISDKIYVNMSVRDILQSLIKEE